ncbi:MAG: response regulator [Polyangiaceae bacterium]
MSSSVPAFYGQTGPYPAVQVRARVLVVDDSATILKVVSAILARHGYVTQTARDGLMGIELLKRGQAFDLVLLDFVMPRMNGYQFCRELRSAAGESAPPVVLMSAKSDKIREQFVQQTGAVDAISKPFDARALIAVVESGLAKAKQAAAAREKEMLEPVEEPRPSVFSRKLKGTGQEELARRMVALLTDPLAAIAPGKAGEVEKVIRAAIEGGSLDELFVAVRGAASATSREILAGDLARVPLAEVMQMMQMQRQTGLMRVEDAKRVLVISVRDGLIDFARLTGGRSEFRIGRYLVELGAATKAQVDEAEKKATAEGRRIGEVLVESSVVSAAAREEALIRQVSDLVYDMLRWSAGRFWFTQEAFSPEAEEARLGLGVASLLLEGFRRVDEWRLMEPTIAWDQVLSVDEKALAPLREKLSRAEKLVVDAVDGKRTLDEVLAASHLGSFDAVKVVYQFLKSRVLVSG